MSFILWKDHKNCLQLYVFEHSHYFHLSFSELWPCSLHCHLSPTHLHYIIPTASCPLLSPRPVHLLIHSYSFYRFLLQPLRSTCLSLQTLSPTPRPVRWTSHRQALWEVLQSTLVLTVNLHFQALAIPRTETPWVSSTCLPPSLQLCSGPRLTVCLQHGRNLLHLLPVSTPPIR